MNEEEVRKIIREELQSFITNDRFTFQKNLQIFDNRDIQVGKTNGTRIGTEASQKLGFFGKTPIVQVSAISAPAINGSAEDAVARAAISSIITALKNLGLTA